MGSRYGDSQIERIKSPLSVASEREAQVGKGRERGRETERKKAGETRETEERMRGEAGESKEEDSIGHGRAQLAPCYLLTLNAANCLPRISIPKTITI